MAHRQCVNRNRTGCIQTLHGVMVAGHRHPGPPCSGMEPLKTPEPQQRIWPNRIMPQSTLWLFRMTDLLRLSYWDVQAIHEHASGYRVDATELPGSVDTIPVFRGPMRKVVVRTLILIAGITDPVVASAQRQPPDSVAHAKRWVALQWGVREQRGPELERVENTERQGLFAVVAQVQGSASGGMLVLGEVWARQAGCIASTMSVTDSRYCSHVGGHVAVGAQHQLGSGRSGLKPYVSAFVGASHAARDDTRASFGVGTALVKRWPKGPGVRVDLRYTTIPGAYYRTNVVGAVGLFLR